MLEANIYNGVSLFIASLLKNYLEYMQREHSNAIGHDVSLRYNIFGWCGALSEVFKKVILDANVGPRLLTMLLHDFGGGGPVLLYVAARFSEEGVRPRCLCVYSRGQNASLEISSSLGRLTKVCLRDIASTARRTFILEIIIIIFITLKL